MIFTPQGFNGLMSRLNSGTEIEKPFNSGFNRQKVEPGTFLKSLVNAAEEMKPLEPQDNRLAEKALSENQEKMDLSDCLALQLSADGAEVMPGEVSEWNEVSSEVPEGVEDEETTGTAACSPSEVLDFLTKIASEYAARDKAGIGAADFSDSGVGNEGLQNYLERLLRILSSGRISVSQMISSGEEALSNQGREDIGGNFPASGSEFDHEFRKLSERLTILMNAADLATKPDLPSGENRVMRNADVEAPQHFYGIDRTSGEKLQAAGSVIEKTPVRSADSGRSHEHHLAQVLQVIEARGGASRQSIVAGEAALSKVPEDISAAAHSGGQTAPAEMSFRQLLSILAGEDQATSAAGYKTIGDKPAGEQVLQKVENLLLQIEAGSSEIKFPVIRENEQASTGSILPSQLVSGGSEKTVEMVPELRQAAMAADKNLHSVEQRIVNQVFVRLSTGVQQGSGNMTIHMHPPELGRVRVRLVSEQGNLNIHLHPQNHQVVGILEKHLPILQQALEDQGVLLSDLQVSVDSGSQGEPQSGGHGRWSADRNPSSHPIEDEQTPLASTQYPARTDHKHELSLRV